MVTTTTWKKVAWKAQVIILSCYQKTLAVSKKEVFTSYHNKFTDLDYRNTGNRRSCHKCQQNYARVQIPMTQIFDAS